MFTSTQLRGKGVWMLSWREREAGKMCIWMIDILMDDEFDFQTDREKQN